MNVCTVWCGLPCCMVIGVWRYLRIATWLVYTFLMSNKDLIKYKKQRLYTVRIDNKCYDCKNSTRVQLINNIKHDMTSELKVCVADEPCGSYPYTRTRTLYIKTIKTIDNGFYNLIVEKIDNKIVNKEILFVRNEENQGCVKRILTLNNDMLYSDKPDSDKPWSDLP